MKFCPKCGAQNQDDSAFCQQCGQKLEMPEASTGDLGAGLGGVGAAGGEFLNKAGDLFSAGAKRAKEAAAGAQKAASERMAQAEQQRQARAAERAAEARNSSMFIDEDETVVASIGSNYMQNYLAGGGLRQGIGILTQKRFYYKGHNFSGQGRGLQRTTDEGVVALEDVTFSMFSFTRHIGLLICGILMALVGLFLFVSFHDTYFPKEFTFGAFLLAILFIVLYFFKRQTLFLVSFPGGGFAFDVRYYPIADVRNFQRQLHLLKDALKNA